ncbi:MAG TPA: carboxypeptidase regulatory-like domain-containing protein [Pyrinomonadaceae bacterium]|nr:carboxypeptidase regulatory-like domain-containing protein [Pyrinomonadaceae bacterium]
MKFPLSILAIASVIVLSSPASTGQTVVADLPASISGRVTVGGKSAAGIRVVATISEPLNKRIAGKATTDQEGNYRITGLQPGRYTVTPVARAYVRLARGGGPDHSSRPLNVSAGDEISKIDFNLGRGGVITGRITDPEGSPIIAESVQLHPIDTQYQAPNQPVFFNRANATDDRGIYRVYGLPPGTYKVSVGQPKPESSSNIYQSGSKYVQTFYPGVLEEAKATIIEIKEGSEVKDVDIRASKGARGFSVTGRVVDASNKPAPNIFVGYSAVEDAKPGTGSMNFSPSATDANGKFTIDGLPPGQYVAFSLGMGMENSSYSEPVKFEITEGDVSGIEIKLSRGATVSGVAIIENNQDPAVAAVLQTVTVYAFGEQKPTGGVPTFARSTIKSDGSFKFTGLAPGKVRISMMGFPTPPKGLSLTRVEHAGVAQRVIEVASGADVSDVRLVFAYGGGSLRGTVKVSGGTADGATFIVLLNQGLTEEGGNKRTIEVDSRGHFFADDIPAGTYEVVLYGKVGENDIPGLSALKQTVTIIKGQETQLTLNVDLSTQK